MARHRMYPPPRRPQRGAIAVAFILGVVLLLGFVGLVVDSSRLFVSKTELQSAADACALSASGALTGANANQLAIAEAAGITAGSRNLVGMQEDPVSIPANEAVTFSATLDGNYQTKDAIGAGAAALNMRFVRCTVAETAIPTLLIQVLNAFPGVSIGPGTARATAVASLEPSISNCALPLAVCKKTGSSAPYWGYDVGEWIQGRWGAGGGLTGTYKWVQFPGFERTPDLESLLLGSGQCNLSGTATVKSHEGVINSLVDAWNSRFGVYKGSGLAGVPDESGYAYSPANWSAQKDAFQDFRDTRRPANSPWNNVPSLGGGWRASTSEEHASGGDRRLVVGPIVDCDALGDSPSAPVPVLGWACYLMLNPVSNPQLDWMGLEFRGTADEITSGCVTSGMPGGPSAGGPKVPTLRQ